MGVELVAGDEAQQVAALLRIDEQDRSPSTSGRWPPRSPRAGASGLAPCGWHHEAQLVVLAGLDGRMIKALARRAGHAGPARRRRR